jgi:serine protease Do
MNRRLIGSVLAALAMLSGAALSATSVRASHPELGASQSAADWDALQARIEAQVARLQARAEAKWNKLLAKLDHARLAQEMEKEHSRMAERMAREQARWAEEMADFALEQEPIVVFGDGESGWLGVTIDEVTAEKAKELKLPAERGAYVREVSEDSPAAKAGLKAGDVITEYNGQRVEGTVQLRRLVRETPAGRAVQLTVWRDGRSQTLSAQLGSARDRSGAVRGGVMPRDFEFDIRIPRIETFGMIGRTPVLGISGDDLSGQLGKYFGAPDGEGVLVREVREGSAAAKAGLQAGDVIVKVEGERVRTTSELRERLRAHREKKSVALGVLRKGAETTVSVELEQPQERRPARTISRRTTL